MTNSQAHSGSDAGRLHPRSLSGLVKRASLRDVAIFMSSRNVGAAGIYSADGKELEGIITERDITRAVAEGLDPEHTLASTLMTEDVVSARSPLSAEQARSQMKEAHIRHLIVQHNGGDHIVSLRDV